MSSEAGNSLRTEGQAEGCQKQWDEQFDRAHSEMGKVPTPPAHVIQLNTILSGTPVDLKRLGRVLDSDPNLAGQVIKLCNSSLFNLPNPVSSLEQAVLMLGTDHLRTLVLTCALVESVGNLIAPREQYRFWERGFLAAAVSEGLARRTGYPEVELAYFGGLLRDLGTLPLLCTVSEARAGREESRHSMDLREELAGVHHCDLGRRIGILWNFPLPLLEVFEFHHEPQRARDYKTFVGIVALAEQFCRTQCLDPNQKRKAALNRSLLCALTPHASPPHRRRWLKAWSLIIGVCLSASKLAWVRRSFTPSRNSYGLWLQSPSWRRPGWRDSLTVPVRPRSKVIARGPQAKPWLA